MLKLIIVDDEGRRTVVPFIRQEITIGRQEGNTIRLTERNVSRHHARLFRQNGAVVVEDLGSYNGIRLNGQRIDGTAELQGGDRIQIGDYELAIDDGRQAAQDKIPTRELDLGLPRTQPATAVPPPAQTADAQQTTSEHRRAVPPATAARLIALNTELAGREFPCTGPDLKIGRSPENDIVLDHPSLSATQARLVREPSGEWQIVDLESSNGLSVNGQTFGVARLRYGDVVELGELKLKFLAPPAGADVAPSPARSSGPLGTRLLIGALVLLAATAAVVFFLARKDGSPPVAERALPTAEPPSPVPKPAAENTATQAGAAPTAPAEAPRSPPAAPQPEQFEERIQLANAAMAQRDFKKAIEIFESVKTADGSRPEQVAEPLSRAAAELSAEEKLASARKSLAAGKPDDALRLLRQAEGTSAFAKEHAQLKARAEALSRQLPRKKEREVKVARAAKPRPIPAPPPADAAAPPPEDPAERLYQEGIGLYRKGQYADAAGSLNECLKVDPASAKCHLSLGSTYGKLKEPELGAQHYRRFVQLAPEDPEAPRIKLLLEQYEAAKELAK